MYKIKFFNGGVLLPELKDIKSMALQELGKDLTGEGVESYRAKQIYEWLTKGISSFKDMTNIPIKMREALENRYFLYDVKIVGKFVSKKDGTVKYLFMLHDGGMIESVLMKYKHGYSVCISTQAGCKMRCSFCATGKDRFLRDLKPSEMLSQIQKIQTDNNIRVSNIVLMGMGEPLDNYDNTVKFLKLVSCPEGVNVGMRHISVSTCGIVDKIYKLAQENFQITLSVSLHAPSDEIRCKIMPVNKRWGIKELIESCRYYTEKTKRRISFEYAMIKNLNDGKENAQKLAEILKGMLCHVNLIPVNSIKESPFEKSDIFKIEEFSNVLAKRGINVTVRRTLGPDINASCGQLRQRKLNGEE